MQTSGTLVKYSDNNPTGITLEISGTSGTWNYESGLGHPETGDVFDLFYGYLDANGMSYFIEPLTYNFTGMDPNQTYDIAMYSARGPLSNLDPRLNTFIISDVDAFTNSSSTVTTFLSGKETFHIQQQSLLFPNQTHLCC